MGDTGVCLCPDCSASELPSQKEIPSVGGQSVLRCVGQEWGAGLGREWGTELKSARGSASGPSVLCRPPAELRALDNCSVIR